MTQQPTISTSGNIPIRWDDDTYTHYRIEFDFSDPRHHYQRHVWIRKDGSEMIEKWIRTAGG